MTSLVLMNCITCTNKLVASKQKQFIALVLIMACRKEKQKKKHVCGASAALELLHQLFYEVLCSYWLLTFDVVVGETTLSGGLRGARLGSHNARLGAQEQRNLLFP